MQNNEIEYLGHKISTDLDELLSMLDIDKRTRDYVRLKQAIKIIEKVTGFTKENADGIRVHHRG